MKKLKQIFQNKSRNFAKTLNSANSFFHFFFQAEVPVVGHRYQRGLQLSASRLYRFHHVALPGSESATAISEDFRAGIEEEAPEEDSVPGQVAKWPSQVAAMPVSKDADAYNMSHK